MKRILSLIMAFSLVVVSIPNVMATENHIEDEIQKRYESEMDSIYTQLDEQNALDMIDIYEPIIYAMAEGSVYAERGVMPMGAEDERVFWAYDGGVVSYMKPREYGVAPVPIVMTALTNEQSSELLESNGTDGYTLAGLITAVAGFIPKMPSIPLGIVSLFLWSKEYVLQSQMDSINDADDYAMIINTTRHIDDSVSVGISGWTTYPMIYLPHNMSVLDADFESF